MAGHLWWILVSKTLLVLFTAREAETREDSTLNNSIKNLRWLPHPWSTCTFSFLKYKDIVPAFMSGYHTCASCLQRLEDGL